MKEERRHRRVTLYPRHFSLSLIRGEFLFLLLLLIFRTIDFCFSPCPALMLWTVQIRNPYTCASSDSFPFPDLVKREVRECFWGNQEMNKRTDRLITSHSMITEALKVAANVIIKNYPITCHGNSWTIALCDWLQKALTVCVYVCEYFLIHNIHPMPAGFRQKLFDVWRIGFSLFLVFAFRPSVWQSDHWSSCNS